MKYLVHTPSGSREIPIHFPEHANRLAIALSGGFDSAVLLWVLAQEVLPAGAELVAVCMMRGTHTNVFAQQMLSTVNEAFQLNIKLLTIDCDPKIPHTKVGQNLLNNMSGSTYDHIISASTSNPPILLPGLAPIRVPEHIRVQNAHIWSFPFMHCDKTHTIQLAKDLGILDWVARQSNTCTEREDVRCGECWQCNERSWAFSQLNLVDTGRN